LRILIGMCSMTCVCMHIIVLSFLHIEVFVCVFICIRVYACIYMHMYKCKNMRTCACTHTLTNIHMWTTWSANLGMSTRRREIESVCGRERWIDLTQYCVFWSLYIQYCEIWLFCTHVYACAHIHTRIYVHIYTCTHMVWYRRGDAIWVLDHVFRMWVMMTCVCVCVCMCVCVCTCVCVCLRTCVCAGDAIGVLRHVVWVVVVDVNAFSQ